MKALIIGATGATGKDLVEQLLQNPKYTEILLFVRKNANIKNSKIREYIVDFDNPESWKNLAKGDVCFSCLGTTLKVAGSKENQWKVDYTYQYNFAKTASENKVPNFVLVSSFGASEKSKFFYTKMKGELEEAIKKLNFSKLIIFRPPSLIRENTERNAEVLTLKLLKFFNSFGILKSYKAISTENLAKAMILSVEKCELGITVLDNQEIAEFVHRN